MVAFQSGELDEAKPFSPRKQALLDHAEGSGGEQYRRGKYNGAYREDDLRFTQFLIPPGKRVLDLGCGRGDLLASLRPSHGIGVDFSPRTIARARELHPGLHFILGDAEDPAILASLQGPFDYIVITDTIGMFEDIDGTLKLVHGLCEPSTRIVIAYYSHLWEPVLKLAELLSSRAGNPRSIILRRSIS
jgi:ubiquinone/menaquinone biosynthesis C-methylase UbiE